MQLNASSSDVEQLFLSKKCHCYDSDSQEESAIVSKIEEANMLINRVKDTLDHIRKSKIKKSPLTNVETIMSPIAFTYSSETILKDGANDDTFEEHDGRPKTRRPENFVCGGDTVVDGTKFRTDPPGSFEKEVMVLQTMDSNEYLQMKLNTISEQSESDESSVSKRTNGNDNQVAVDKHSIEVQVSLENLVPDHQNKSIQHEECIDKKTPQSRKGTSRLTIQKLPPINIRRGLSLQRTLNLFIDSDGITSNFLSANIANVCYNEVSVVRSDPKVKETIQAVIDDNPVQEKAAIHDNPMQELPKELETNGIITSDSKDEKTSQSSSCGDNLDNPVLHAAQKFPEKVGNAKKTLKHHRSNVDEGCSEILGTILPIEEHEESNEANLQQLDKRLKPLGLKKGKKKIRTSLSDDSIEEGVDCVKKGSQKMKRKDDMTRKRHQEIQSTSTDRDQDLSVSFVLHNDPDFLIIYPEKTHSQEEVVGSFETVCDDETMKIIQLLHSNQPLYGNELDGGSSIERISVCKSFQVIDNVTKHEPEPLDFANLNRLSAIDPLVYKTYIDHHGVGIKQIPTTFYRKSRSRSLAENRDDEYTGSAGLYERMFEKPANPAKLFEYGFLKSKSTQCNSDQDSNHTNSSVLTKLLPKENTPEVSVVLVNNISDENKESGEKNPVMQENTSDKCQSSNQKDSISYRSENGLSLELVINIEEDPETSQTTDRFDLQKDFKRVTGYDDKNITLHQRPEREIKPKTEDKAVSILPKEIDALRRISLDKLSDRGSSQSEEIKVSHPVDINELYRSGAERERAKATANSFYLPLSPKYPIEQDASSERKDVAKVAKKPIRKAAKKSTISDYSTVDYMSDGEVKCRCSAISVGEIHRCPYENRMHSRVKMLKPKKLPKVYSIMDANVKIERHRRYFNNWVTYYIHKNNHTINDSSSASSSYN